MTDGRQRYAVAIDLGTGGPKIGLVSLTGRIAWNEHLRVSTRFVAGGGAVQDAEEWWRLIAGAIRRALQSGVVESSDVVAVSCTGQWASTVPVGEDGVPVGDCVLWMDTRGGTYARKAFGGPVAGYAPRAIWRFVRRTAGAPSISGADPIGHILHLENDQPEVARRTRWYLEPVDYLSMRFTGIAAATHASMTAAWLTDNRHTERLSYDPVLLKASGVPLDRLPPLVATGSITGEVREDVARELGLPGGVKVVSGTPDLHSAAVGSGRVLDYQAHTVISTTSWTSCPVPWKKTDTQRQIASIPGLSPGRYLVVDNQDTAGVCLEWLRDQVIAPADGLCGGTTEMPSLDSMTALAASVPPGSGDVVFTPWLTGERSPMDDRNARGGFHNVSLLTTRAHLVRAVMEGVAYNNRWLYEAVERFVRRRLDPVRVIGGGAVSELWCQMLADVLGRTVERVADPLHANLRGAGLWAGLAMGDVRFEDLAELVPVDRRFEPDPSASAAYERLFSEFPRLYTAQKPIFKRLNSPAR
ncbi:MAG TPA: FGGY-family carbohydrate kinase [Acidimicrobiales bacterium]|nr:FGGY-family carbohydrate kinase [Acidimicrobiales bacterium]